MKKSTKNRLQTIGLCFLILLISHECIAITNQIKHGVMMQRHLHMHDDMFHSSKTNSLRRSTNHLKEFHKIVTERLLFEGSPLLKDFSNLRNISPSDILSNQDVKTHREILFSLLEKAMQMGGRAKKVSRNKFGYFKKLVAKTGKKVREAKKLVATTGEKVREAVKVARAEVKEGWRNLREAAKDIVLGQIKKIMDSPLIKEILDAFRKLKEWFKNFKVADFLSIITEKLMKYIFIFFDGVSSGQLSRMFSQREMEKIGVTKEWKEKFSRSLKNVFEKAFRCIKIFPQVLLNLKNEKWMTNVFRRRCVNDFAASIVPTTSKEKASFLETASKLVMEPLWDVIMEISIYDGLKKLCYIVANFFFALIFGVFGWLIAAATAWGGVLKVLKSIFNVLDGFVKYLESVPIVLKCLSKLIKIWEYRQTRRMPPALIVLTEEVVYIAGVVARDFILDRAYDKVMRFIHKKSFKIIKKNGWGDGREASRYKNQWKAFKKRMKDKELWEFVKKAWKITLHYKQLSVPAEAVVPWVSRAKDFFFAADVSNMNKYKKYWSKLKLVSLNKINQELLIPGTKYTGDNTEANYGNLQDNYINGINYENMLEAASTTEVNEKKLENIWNVPCSNPSLSRATVPKFVTDSTSNAGRCVDVFQEDCQEMPNYYSHHDCLGRHDIRCCPDEDPVLDRKAQEIDWYHAGAQDWYHRRKKFRFFKKCKGEIFRDVKLYNYNSSMLNIKFNCRDSSDLCDCIKELQVNLRRRRKDHITFFKNVKIGNSGWLKKLPDKIHIGVKGNNEIQYRLYFNKTRESPNTERRRMLDENNKKWRDS
eukprot:g5938.t1